MPRRTAANKGKTVRPAKDPLTEEEKQYIKDHMTTKPCLRCDDPVHTAVSCTTVGYKGTRGWYAQLSLAKKKSADVHIGKLQLKKEEKKEEKGKVAPVKPPMIQNPGLEPLPPARAQGSLPTAKPTGTQSDIDADGTKTKVTMQPAANDGKGQSPQGDTQYQRGYKLVNLERTEPRMPPRTNVRNLQLTDGKLYTNALDPKKLQALGNETEFPTRPEFLPKTTDVLTNHFEITVNPKTTFYEYKVLGLQGAKNRKMRKIFIDTAIEHTNLRTLADRFATDNFDTIVSWVKLEDNLTSTSSDEWILCDVQDGELDISLKLKFVRIVDISSLQKYVASDITSGVWDSNQWNSSNTVNALNIVVSKFFRGEIVKLGANKFFVESGHKDLGRHRDDLKASLCTIRGYFYTIKPGTGKILLNMNYATSAFFKDIPVSEFLINNTFGNDTAGLLRNLRVYINYIRGRSSDSPLDKPSARVKRIFELGPRSVQDQTFPKTTKDEDGNETTRDVTVKEHLEQNTNPELRCVNLGGKNKKSWFAPEHLRIMPYQMYNRPLPDFLTASMLEEACKKPNENRRCIEGEGLMKLQLNDQTPLRIAKTMLKVPCHVLDYPLIQYRETSVAPEAKEARWNLRDTQFHSCGDKWNTETFRYAMVFAPKLRFLRFERNQKQMEEAFQKQLVERGVGKSQCTGRYTMESRTLNYESLKNEILQYYSEEMGKLTPDLIVLVQASKDPQSYADFKYLCDKVFGFQSIMMTEAANLKPDKKSRDPNAKFFNVSPQYMGNVAMKANLKRGGINHYVEATKSWLEDTLVLGADVTHPGPGALPGCPSIAAVVGSVDETGGKFLGSLKLQAGKQEMIDDMTGRVAGRICAWYNKNKKLPQNILYYRDGVSESQYQQVKTEELSHFPDAWRTAIKTLGFQLDHIPDFKLTAVVVTKRHHTRFYPTNKNYTMFRNENCTPGTIVDQAVTSPYWDDFYLQSHNAIQGTAKPAHYFILQNDMDMSTAQLQRLTHDLCHSYVRATLAVSYASPAYYADRLCDRGRQYLREFFAPSRNKRDWFDRYKKQLETQRKAGRSVVAERNSKVRRPEKEVLAERLRDAEDKKWVDDQLQRKTKEEVAARWDPVDEYRPAGRFARELEARKRDLLQTMYWM